MLVKGNRSQYCLQPKRKKKKTSHYASEKRWLSYFSNTCHQLGRCSHETCSNLAFIYTTIDELHFEVFWSHGGWLNADNRCKRTKSADFYIRTWWSFQSTTNFLQCIEIKQLDAGTKRYLFCSFISLWHWSQIFLWQSLWKFWETLPETGFQTPIQKWSLGDNCKPAQLLNNMLHQCVDF